MATYIISMERDHWDSKNFKDWIIRSEATLPPLKKEIKNLLL
jgi:hypothetical protein